MKTPILNYEYCIQEKSAPVLFPPLSHLFLAGKFKTEFKRI